jgi:hypothetical protein
MQGFQALAEQRIREAIERGELDNLPGAGRPLDLEDDPLVPSEVRIVHRIHKNAGVVPLEVLERRELALLEQEALNTQDGGERAAALGRLALLRSRLDARRSASSLRLLLLHRRAERIAGAG